MIDLLHKAAYLQESGKDAWVRKDFAYAAAALQKAACHFRAHDLIAHGDLDSAGARQMVQMSRFVLTMQRSGIG